MSRILTEAEIARLLNEPKKLPSGWQTRLTPRPVSETNYSRRKLKLTGDDGSQFRIDIRDNQILLFDFSIILTYVQSKEQEYILTRFNGRHPSDHTNKIEKKGGLPNAKFRNTFHIHTATERYQVAGFAIDGYAEPTTRYVSFETALRSFVRSNGFYIDGERTSLDLFDEQQ